MKLHLDNRTDALLVHSCALAAAGSDSNTGNGRHRIKVADKWYDHSLLLTAQAVQTWDVADASALRAAHFRQLAELGVEVILLGTGKRAVFPPPVLTQPLMGKRIGLEVMDTAAACRTYNVLAADGRSVAAALIA